MLEESIQQSGLSYSIIRPTVIFGKGDILINNIAYLLRHSPVFIIPGSGDYQLQPIYVGDFAEIIVKAGQSKEDLIFDAVGPEIFTYNQLDPHPFVPGLEQMQRTWVHITRLNSSDTTSNDLSMRNKLLI